MIVTLIRFGLLVLPIFVWPGFDTREPKLILALFLSLIIGLYGIYTGSIKRYPNVWVLAFLAFIPLNYVLSPRIDVFISGVPVASWVLQAFLFVLVFFLGHLTIAGGEFSVPDTDRILDTAVTSGFISAGFAIGQLLGFRQFFVGSEKAIAAAMGNPNVLAAWLSMLVPIALYRKRYLPAIVITVVVLLTNSQMAYGSLILSTMFLLGTKNRELRILMISGIVLITLVLAFGYFRSSAIKSFVGDSGRFATWGRIIRDVQSPVIPGDRNTDYSITGRGLGSFRYMFHTQNPDLNPKEPFLEAHNDYLELLYNGGLFGLGLFLIAIVTFMVSCFPLDRFRAHLLASFLCIAINAGGLFVWQNGAIIFYTLVITGLLIQKGPSNAPTTIRRTNRYPGT